MDWQTGFTVACAIASGALSLWTNSLRSDLSQMKHDHKALQQLVSNLREAIPQRYATIDDLRDSIKLMTDTLHRIESKLDSKADKK